MQSAVIDPTIFSTLVPIKTLSPEHCRQLAKQSELSRFTRGQILFQENQPVDRIYYLLRGEIQFLRSGAASRQIKSGTRMATLPLAQGKVFQETAQAIDEVVCLKVDPETLDIMLTWNQSGGYEVQEIDKQSSTTEDGDWMSRLLQAKVFHQIPPANIQTVFMKMESNHFKAGEYVIRQGDDGDKFFIIREGKCQVTRQTRKNPEGMILANLGPGDHFGEESLISGGKRNASIQMLTDGVLMSLSKADFLSLLNEPLLKWVGYTEAKKHAEEGAIWIDVRLPAEYEAGHLTKSVNIPLPLLRAKLDKLDRKHRYLVYCDTGRRGSIAAYLMSQNGIQALILQDPFASLPATELA